MTPDRKTIKEILVKHDVVNEKLLDALCEAFGVTGESLQKYVVITSTHRQHGFNIQHNKGKVAEVISEKGDRLFLRFNNGSTAFIRRNYTQPFEPYESGHLHSINMQYEHGREWRRKLGIKS